MSIALMNPSPLIWIIEDEEDLATTYAEYLSPQYQTKVFLTAKEALAQFESGEDRPAIIITDVKLPFMDGISFLGEIKKKYRPVPAIMISGYAEKNELVRAAMVGIQGYLDKPFHLNLLNHLIEKVLKEDALVTDPFTLYQDRTVLADEYSALCVQRYMSAENALSQAGVPYPESGEAMECHRKQLGRENLLSLQLRELDSKINVCLKN